VRPSARIVRSTAKATSVRRSGASPAHGRGTGVGAAEAGYADVYGLGIAECRVAGGVGVAVAVGAASAGAAVRRGQVPDHGVPAEQDQQDSRQHRESP
jgi:hypothetical protein